MVGHILMRGTYVETFSPSTRVLFTLRPTSRMGEDDLVQIEQRLGATGASVERKVDPATGPFFHVVADAKQAKTVRGGIEALGFAAPKRRR